MDDPQFIRTPNGEELVVLSRRDYDSLVETLAEAEEELADIAALDGRKADIAAALVPPLPAAVSALLMQGHRRLTALTLWRGLTAAELAQRAGIIEQSLAGFESGVCAPDSAAATRLAAVLDVPVAWFSP